MARKSLSRLMRDAASAADKKVAELEKRELEHLLGHYHPAARHRAKARKIKIHGMRVDGVNPPDYGTGKTYKPNGPRECARRLARMTGVRLTDWIEV